MTASADQVYTDTIQFPFGSQSRPAYLALPDGSGPFPAVVIIHEIFGLNENIKEIARRFAGAGYAALAVDLFAGRNRAVCMARFMGQMQFKPLEIGRASCRERRSASVGAGGSKRTNRHR